MKAAVLYSDGIRVTDVDNPDVESKDVLIKVAYCGICGSDIPRVKMGAAHFYPIILGHEFSGVVVAVGSEVNTIKEGDKVVGIPLVPCFACDSCASGNYSLCSNYSFVGSRQNGAYAEYVSIPSTNVLKIPNSMDLVLASTIEPCSVSRHAFSKVDVRKKVVGVIGSGIIGLYAVQWSKLLGAKKTVLITHGNKDISPSEVNADLVVSDKECSSFFDIIIDCAGNEDSLTFSLNYSHPLASIVLVGTPTLQLSFNSKDWEKINRKELTIIGSWMSYSSPFPGIEWMDSIDKMASNQITLVPKMVSKIIPMIQINDAFNNIDMLKKNGRVIISID